MLKKCKVVLLPTNQRALDNKEGKVLFFNSKQQLIYYPSSLSEALIYNLYFLSNEEIKEGDWFFYQRVGALNAPILATTKNEKYWKENEAKKIIATTDKLLIGIDWMKGQAGEYDKNAYLPQPSQSFIDVFVREYNKGNVIKEVMVEYEGFGGKSYDINNIPYRNGYRLKINPKDNTITIKRVKDSWNREEVHKLLHLIIDTYPGGPVSKDITNNWIKNNL